MFEDPHELRLLANWYRDWAELGDALDRIWRKGLVEFLEKRAAEIEASRIERPAVKPDYCYPHGLCSPT